MGLYDTMQQGAMGQAQPMNAGNKVLSAVPNAMGQGFAQQKPVGNMQKPNNNMMRAGQAAGNVVSNWAQNKFKPTVGQAPAGSMGSRTQIQAKQKAMQQPVQRQESPAQQYGLPTLQTPYDQQIQASKPNAIMQAGPLGQTYGSDKLRELQGMNSLHGTTPLQNAPFGGEQPGSNGFQSMVGNMYGQRPDVMDRGNPYSGIGPSAQLFDGNPKFGQEGMTDIMNQGQPMQQQPVVMDENGLEPRRGAR